MSRRQHLVGEKSVKKPQRNTENVKPLSAESIEKYLRKSRTFLGTINIDSFNKLLIKSKTFSLVLYCNFHWFCVYSTKKTFEIFDPMGFLQKRKCITKKFFKFLKTHLVGKIFYCNPKIQSDQSSLCGFYVIFYIYMRDLGHSFIDILRKFSHKFVKNDRFVYTSVRKMFKK